MNDRPNGGVLALVLLLTGAIGCGRFLPLEPEGASVDGGLDEEAERTLAVSPFGEFDGGSQASRDADAGTDAPGPYVFVPSVLAPSFVDTFARLDGAAIGNGWVEKTPSTFDLLGEQARRIGGAGSYANLILTRPATELGLDVEVSASFTFGDAFDDPSLLVRLRSDVDEVDHLTGYLLRASPIELSVRRYSLTPTVSSAGPLPGGESIASLLPSLVVGQTYRLSARVSGKDPVLVEGALKASDGTLLRSVRGMDASPSRLIEPGRVGLGSIRGSGARWDDFRRIDL